MSPLLSLKVKSALSSFFLRRSRIIRLFGQLLGRFRVNDKVVFISGLLDRDLLAVFNGFDIDVHPFLLDNNFSDHFLVAFLGAEARIDTFSVLEVSQVPVIVRWSIYVSTTLLSLDYLQFISLGKARAALREGADTLVQDRLEMMALFDLRTSGISVEHG